MTTCIRRVQTRVNGCDVREAGGGPCGGRRHLDVAGHGSAAVSRRVEVAAITKRAGRLGLRADHSATTAYKEGWKEMFHLMTHSTHFIYGYMGRSCVLIM